MKNKKNKRLLALILLLISTFLFATGCTININVNNPSNDAENKTITNHNSDTTAKVNIYQSCATIYISQTVTTELPAISSSDLAVSVPTAEIYANILQANRIQNKIHEEYPGVEYELTLEPINETEIFTITATSENPEKLEEICNMAVSLFCEEVPSILAGVSCKVVDYAKSAQLVGTTLPS